MNITLSAGDTLSVKTTNHKYIRDLSYGDGFIVKINKTNNNIDIFFIDSKYVVRFNIYALNGMYFTETLKLERKTLLTERSHSLLHKDVRSSFNKYN